MMNQEVKKKKVSRFEFAIRQIAEPETVGEFRPETIGEEMERRNDKQQKFFKKIIIKR